MFADSSASITKDGITLRLIQAGPFRESHVQGLELELINTTDQPVTCDVRLILHRAAPDASDLRKVQRDERQLHLPAHARQGFRVAEPLAYGRCRAEYEIKVNGAPFASSHVEFVSSGPYRLQVRPWYLTRDAVQVTVELLQPTGKEQFRFRLFDSKRQKVLFETGDYRRLVDATPYGDSQKPKTSVEGFVRFGNSRPGDYLVEVEVRESERSANAARLTAMVVLPPDR